MTGLRDGGPAIQAVPERTPVDAEFSRPLSKCHRPSVQGQQSVTCAVVELCLAGGPPTVSGLVVSVIVDAVDAVLRGGTRPHVGQEVLEVVTPALADTNTAPAVLRVSRVTRIQASASHIPPRRDLRRLRAPVCSSLPTDAFAVVATARGGEAAAQRPRHDQLDGAAVAAAHPDGLTGPRAMRGHLDSDQPTVAMACQVTSSRHCGDYIAPHPPTNRRDT
jgi:hypothetical protein